uniref:WD repeat domain 18 n=1 Tax=Cyanistes caeruleus TaxID=156563 RepID=A0A8C0U2Q8_CYACU
MRSPSVRRGPQIHGEESQTPPMASLSTKTPTWPRSSWRLLCAQTPLHGPVLCRDPHGPSLHRDPPPSPDQLQQKIICPGPVTCLTASPNGLYVLAGVAESIYLWEVSNGNLLAILNRHYQDLTCLCFTDDSSHFLSGAKDCLALVWNLYSVLQAEPSQIPDPRHVWSRHSLPITDLCCGFGGPLARAATASLDQTAKLWEVSSGELLLSVLFDVGIMAVTLDLSEYHMFCGGMDGSIFQVDLCAWPVQRDRTFQSERENTKVFKGHRNQVTCLSVSTDGSLLLSGSHDETVRLWDIQSKQCLKTMNHKGPVTNAFIVLAPANMFNPDGKPSVPLPKFSRHLHGTESSDEPGTEGVTLRLGLHQQVLGASWGGGTPIWEGLCHSKASPTAGETRSCSLLLPPHPGCCSHLSSQPRAAAWAGSAVPPFPWSWHGRQGGSHTISVPPIPAALPVVPELLPSASISLGVSDSESPARADG